MSSEPWIRAASVGNALRVAGVGTDALEGLGIPASGLDDPEARVPLTAYIALLERLAERTGDPCFGLRCGLTKSPQDYGALGYVMASSADLRQAVVNFARYFAVHQQGSELTLVDDEHEGEARIAYRIVDPSIAPRRQDAELSVGSILAALRVLFGPELRPECLWFEHADGPLRATRALVDVPVLYGKPTNAVVVDRALLDQPLPSPDPQLLAIVEGHAAQLIEKFGDGEQLDARVRRIIAERLRDGTPTAGEVAGALGLGESTLRRRLREEGTSFHDQLDMARRGLAEQYLRTSELSISQIAFLLGFSDASAFTRAFKRWHGTPPLQYRRSR